MNKENYIIKNQINIIKSITAKVQTKQEYYEMTESKKEKESIFQLFLEVEKNKQIAKEKTQEMLNALEKETLSFSLYYNNCCVGRVSFSQINTQTPEIEVEIDEGYRRKGIAYNSIKTLIGCAIMKNKNIKYFIYRVRVDNVASINLIEKLGGKVVETDKIVDKIIKTYHLYVK